MSASPHMLQLAKRTASRLTGASVKDIDELLAADDPFARTLAGLNQLDWSALLMQLLQVLLENIQNCQVRPAVFKAIRKPGLIARAVNRSRADRIFRQGTPSLAAYGTLAATALEEEAALLADEDMSAIMHEVNNPNNYMLI